MGLSAIFTLRYVNPIENMKAMLPPYCRWMGYLTLVLSVCAPFALALKGIVTNENLILCKEVIKVFMMAGLLMILLALHPDENAGTERIRTRAMRQAFACTLIYLLLNMLIRVSKGDPHLTDTSSFLVFMAIQVLCLEYGLKKAAIEKAFKERRSSH